MGYEKGLLQDKGVACLVLAQHPQSHKLPFGRLTYIEMTAHCKGKLKGEKRLTTKANNDHYIILSAVFIRGNT